MDDHHFCASELRDVSRGLEMISLEAEKAVRWCIMEHGSRPEQHFEVSA